MAHFLDMTVVGEGIETAAQWKQLRDLKCDDGQGFLVSKAVPPNDLLELLRTGSDADIPHAR
jgi:EAL domain-containing protein (putative c-di-GMP-specific phosphodiesterase class I)